MVADQYLDDQSVETRRRTPAEGPTLQTRMGAELRVNENRFGSLEMTITDVRFFDRKGQEITGLHHGEALRSTSNTSHRSRSRAPIFGVTISREDGLICCDTSTASAGLLLPTAQDTDGSHYDLSASTSREGSTMPMSASTRPIGHMRMIIIGTSIRYLSRPLQAIRAFSIHPIAG